VKEIKTGQSFSQFCSEKVSQLLKVPTLRYIQQVCQNTSLYYRVTSRFNASQQTFCLFLEQEQTYLTKVPLFGELYVGSSFQLWEAFSMAMISAQLPAQPFL